MHQIPSWLKLSAKERDNLLGEILASMGLDEKEDGDVDNKDNSDSAAVGDNID